MRLKRRFVVENDDRFCNHLTMRFSAAVLILVASACTLPEATRGPVTTTATTTVMVTTATVSRTSTTASAATPPVAESSTVTTSFSEVASVRIAPEREGGYQRRLFKHWSDLDGDGCDTRREVLIEESIEPVTVAIGCSLQGGRWYSAFDGVETDDPSTFDVDHMVPLKEAWDSGAWAWDAARRQAFANDTTLADALIAVSASSNRSKGSKDPAEWMPPLESFRCSYVAAWLAVKRAWKLSMDEAEYETIETWTQKC